MRLILASQSPRRRELLTAIGLNLEICATDVDEVRLDGEAPRAMAERLAALKAHAVACDEDTLVIAADTVVALDDDVFGKPADNAEAALMLSALSGREHAVITGFCVRSSQETRVGAVTTQVWFRALTAHEIAAYVASGESRDKAGAYGIQGRGGALIDRVDGSYPNVVGLPVAEVVAALRALGATC